MLQALADMLATIDIQQLAVVWVIVVFAAVMRAFTGFGFALSAVPAFSMLMAPTQAVVLSVMLTLAVSLFTLKTFWGLSPLKPMAPLISTSLVGTAIGASLVGMISTESFQLWIGLSVISACAILTFYHPKHQLSSPVIGGVTGAISGLMNGAFAIPGPPVVVYAVATQSTPEHTRSLLLTLFFFSATDGLIFYLMAGYVSMASLWLFLLTFPSMVLGDKLGYRLFKQYGTKAYRRVALIVLFAVGVITTAKALLGS